MALQPQKTAPFTSVTFYLTCLFAPMFLSWAEGTDGGEVLIAVASFT
jgi:hypothetical protein